ncbi:unnamed protein product [Auanema sp. JU1783]|nr:unnamed protein product [Auanema sp. JU1783]
MSFSTVLNILYLLLAINQVRSTEETSVRSKRLAIHPSRWNMNLWPGAEVPYDIAPHYTLREREVILSAMAEFHKVTCIRFRPRKTGDRFYLQVNKYYNLERCFSYIGRQTGFMFRTREGNYETRMKLDPSCLLYNGRGTVMHELMHILGFYHEHQRDDRDPRVGRLSNHYNYKIYPRFSSYYMGAYDPTSIMHYNFPGIVYPRTYFSASDINRLNSLYKCKVNRQNTTSVLRSVAEQQKSSENFCRFLILFAIPSQVHSFFFGGYSNCGQTIQSPCTCPQSQSPPQNANSYNRPPSYVQAPQPCAIPTSYAKPTSYGASYPINDQSSHLKPSYAAPSKDDIFKPSEKSPELTELYDDSLEDTLSKGNFRKTSASETLDAKCSSEVLKNIMNENMDSASLTKSKKSISDEAKKVFGYNFDVICSSAHFTYIIASSLYCEQQVRGVICLAYQH